MKSNLVRIDWTKTASRIRPGSYRFRVKAASHGMSQAGNAMVIVRSIGLSGAAEGRHFKLWLVRWKLRQFLDVVRIAAARPEDVDLAVLVGREFTARVEDVFLDGTRQSRIVGF
jgi:hypothetical protein